MKKFFTVLAVGLLIAALSVPALAWEIDLKGDFIYKYDYISQGGSNGFFGPYDFMNSAIAGEPNWAAMNGWAGARSLQGGQLGTQFGMVTGADASYNYQRMEFFPEIRINPAVRLRGAYQIGGIKPAATPYVTPGGPTVGTAPTQIVSPGFPYVVGPLPPYEYSVYQNSAAFGAWNPIDTGAWTQWWATAQTPWGILVFGKRGLGFGTGVQYVESSASSESLAIVAPYGPFRIGLGGYLHRRATWINAYPIDLNPNLWSAALFPGTTADYTANAGAFFISNFDGGAQPKPWDHDAERHGQPFIFLTYQSGDLDAGFIYEWFMEHDGPASRAAWNTASTGNQNAITRDGTLEDGSVYVKYNNGRFFLNSEVAWVRGNTHYQLPQSMLGLSAAYNIPGGGGNAFAPHSLEAWKFGTELGVICGPTKLSFLFSWVPGPDRRHGIWINGQTWENVINGTFLGNSQYFKPYSMLLAYQYGSGLNALDRNGEGYMTDAITYAARLDYAVAANLNVYGTFLYANRQSKGWGWGSLALAGNTNLGTSTGDVVLLGRANGLGFPIPALNNGFGGSTASALGAPSIPDDNLGWEIDAGVDWKLLEGFQLNLRGAYWRPGEWFSYACIDKRVATGRTGTTTTAPDGRLYGGPVLLYGRSTDVIPGTNQVTWGVMPNKGIDPVYMIQGTLLVDF